MSPSRFIILKLCIITRRKPNQIFESKKRKSLKPNVGRVTEKRLDVGRAGDEIKLVAAEGEADDFSLIPTKGVPAQVFKIRTSGDGKGRRKKTYVARDRKEPMSVVY